MTFFVPHPAELLPHAAPMVLIDTITQWDDNQLCCRANSHLAVSNPLRQAGILSAYAGVEYAAQAMAAHARLTALAKLPTVASHSNNQARKGFLAVASKLKASVANLDDNAGELIITVVLMAGNDDSSLYSFSISADAQILLAGQLMAVLAPIDTGL